MPAIACSDTYQRLHIRRRVSESLVDSGMLRLAVLSRLFACSAKITESPVSLCVQRIYRFLHRKIQVPFSPLGQKLPSNDYDIYQPPILPLNDHIHTVPYPKSGDWDARVGAERLLVLATLFLVNLIQEFGNPAQMDLIRKSMQVLDGEISRSLSELDAHESPDALSIQKKIALVRLHGYVLCHCIQLSRRPAD